MPPEKPSVAGPQVPCDSAACDATGADSDRERGTPVWPSPPTASDDDDDDEPAGPVDGGADSESLPL